MSGYTLKLDLTDYEHGALVTLLRTELDEAERDGRAQAPWIAAIAKILNDIYGYDDAVQEVAPRCSITGERNCKSRDCELHYMDAPISLCPNPWHQSAPARLGITCPECSVCP